MMRWPRLLAAAALSALAGCKPQAPPQVFTDSRIPPGAPAAMLPPAGWAWGSVQAPGAPPQRYGVSAPPYNAKGQVLILPGYGESAETWFETARDLNARGYVVWVLDGVGQGGSARYLEPHDLGHGKAGDADVRAAEIMIKRVIRSPVTLIGADAGAAPALLLAEGGAPVERLVLSAPDVPDGKGRTKWLRGVGLETVRAYGGTWTRNAPLGAGDPARVKTAREWQVANPDLRMGGPSQGWAAMHAEMSARAREGQLHVAPPMVVVAETDPSAFCRRVRQCQAVTVPGAGDRPHLAPDTARQAWLAAFAGPPDEARLAPAAVEARVDR